MKNLWMLKSVGVAACLLCLLLCGCVVNDLGKANYPPEEQTWIKKGWNSAHVDIELMTCYDQGKWRGLKIGNPELRDAVDMCMLRKGFTSRPNPDPSHWMEVCELYPQRVKCRVYRGEFVIPPDETALQIKPDTLVKPTPVHDPVECRKDKPMYEAAYCDCYIRTPYANLESCDRLLKYQYKWSEPSIEPKFTQTQPTPISPAEQLLRENLKELQRAQDKTQIKPYTPPANLPVIPQAPNPRLEKLKGG